MNKLCEPLQTHGLTVWGPPVGGRFMSWSEADREWMEPLGIGRRVTAPLFDVRDELGELIGFTRLNPVGHNHVSVPVLSRPNWSYGNSGEACVKSIALRTIYFQCDERRFICWQCRAEESLDLILVRWIVAVGQETISDFISRIRFRAIERSYRDRYPDPSGRVPVSRADEGRDLSRLMAIWLQTSWT